MGHRTRAQQRQRLTTVSSASGATGPVLRLGLLAGEPSGDRLGAGLMQALQRQLPDTRIEFVGVGGPRMCSAGLDALAHIDELAVNGFREPLLNLPRLLRLLNRLTRELADAQIDAFIGVDFNVFNFLLERRLKKRGVRTVHYVSPSVYAWRRGRAKRIARSTDLLLCLYPFEPAFYANVPVEATFVGHPLADEIDLQAGDAASRAQAREALGLPSDACVLAVLPGSRSSEVRLMLPAFLEAAARFGAAHDAVAVIPCLKPQLRELVEQGVRQHPDLAVQLVDGDARLVLKACDMALVKSGTSTLEAMLLHRPMVVSYRLGALTYQIVRHLIRSPFVALPNILVGEMWVPELLQGEGTGAALADALRTEYALARSDPARQARFVEIHRSLRRDADASAAEAVIGLLRSGHVSGVPK